MAEFFPIRSSAPREPDRRPRPIPRKVRHAPTPGIVIKIINQSAPPVDAGNVIDVTPAPKPVPAIDSSYPIFKPPGY